MDELEVTNCPHCGATIFGVGSLSASGKYCKNCILDVMGSIPRAYVNACCKQAEVIAFAVTGKDEAEYIEDAKKIFNVLKEADPDLLDDYIREYVEEYDADYKAWMMEEF